MIKIIRMYPSDFIVTLILKTVVYGGKNDKNIDCVYLKHPEYSPRKLRRENIPNCEGSCIRLLILSDSHEAHHLLKVLPECDVFIHCGDILTISRLLSKNAGIKRLKMFNEWLGTIPAKAKIVIAGNHDNPIEVMGKDKSKELFTNAIYLENDKIKIGNISIWGTPLSHGSSSNKAFQSKRFETATEKECPESVDILITHGQCPELESKIKHKIHLWGHNHNSYGIRFPGDILNNQPVPSLSICSPIMNGSFSLKNSPIVIDIPMDMSDVSIPSRDEVKINDSFGVSSFTSSRKMKSSRIFPV